MSPAIRRLRPERNRNHPASATDSLKQRKRTWFGCMAAVDLAPGFWHRAGFGRWLVPHPPVANWLLRLGLDAAAALELAAAHEFGHLQSLPLVLLYAGGLLGVAAVTASLRTGDTLLCLLSSFAVWEVFAELYVIWRRGAHYRTYYRGVSPLPRTLFWGLTLSLAAGAGAAMLVG